VTDCFCEPGFEGTNCNVPVGCGSPPEGPPNSETGEVTGTERCNNEYGSFECECSDGWHGTYCHELD